MRRNTENRCHWADSWHAPQAWKEEEKQTNKQTKNKQTVTTFPINMPDPIRIRSGSARKHWPETGRISLAHRLASGPDPFCQNLTQSARIKSYPGWLGHLWKNATESEICKLVAGRLRSARNQARWLLHTGLLPDQIRLARPIIQIGSGSVLHNMIHALFGKWNWIGCRKSDQTVIIHNYNTIWPNSGCTLAVTAITGRNQNASGSNPACLLGQLWQRLSVPIRAPVHQFTRTNILLGSKSALNHFHNSPQISRSPRIMHSYILDCLNAPRTSFEVADLGCPS